MYNKIMKNSSDSGSPTSPFINTEAYNKIMKGGDDDTSSSESNDSDDSTSDSDILKGLSTISISSNSTYHNNKKHKKNRFKPSSRGNQTSITSTVSDMHQKIYGFSNTSSELIKTSEDNYYINNVITTDTPYKLESSSINTSDINLVSVDSRNGRRFL